MQKSFRGNVCFTFYSSIQSFGGNVFLGEVSFGGNVFLGEVSFGGNVFWVKCLLGETDLGEMSQCRANLEPSEIV